MNLDPIHVPREVCVLSFGPPCGHARHRTFSTQSHTFGVPFSAWCNGSAPTKPLYPICSFLLCMALGGLPCSALSFFWAPRDMSTDMGLGYPHGPYSAGSRKSSFFFFSCSHFFRCPETPQSLQVTYHCPPVWQGLGQWWH